MWLTCQSATFDPIAKTQRAGGPAHATLLATAIANSATPAHGTTLMPHTPSARPDRVTPLGLTSVCWQEGFGYTSFGPGCSSLLADGAGDAALDLFPLGRHARA